eukprot:TRINITY_DN41166_c0_g1_i1.p1 TRINITY_DN41166_c0_g1~~TRINITY_DN41166_c0_g1_i1.p1  ORF type:complete len:406 (-),score=77.61 TRINITY_DN41166_c0_g1_i1:567-1784(-)
MAGVMIEVPAQVSITRPSELALDFKTHLSRRSITSAAATASTKRLTNSRSMRHEGLGNTLAFAAAFGVAARSSMRSATRGRNVERGCRRLAVERRVCQVDVEEGKMATRFKEGMSVKVIRDIQLFHVPGFRGTSFNPNGATGRVKSVIEGEHLTANRPVQVKIEKAPAETSSSFKAFIAYFSADELETCDDDKAEEIASEVQSSESAPVSAPASASSASSPSSVSSASSASLASSASSASASVDDRWKINLLYDGKCASCMKQVEFLEKRMDENPEYAGLIRLTDLHAPDYDPQKCGGVVFEDGMRHIHAVTKQGEVITGMDVFRRVYSEVGMEWVYAVTTLPFVGSFFDWAYDQWAVFRLKMLGREDILERVNNHKKQIEELQDSPDCEVECEVDWDNPWKSPA